MISRRKFVQFGLATYGLAATSAFVVQTTGTKSVAASAAKPVIEPPSTPLRSLGPLLPPNELGLRIPQGFTAKVVATAGQRPTADSAPWHDRPDGGACFSTADGGWIYVSNAEVDRCFGGAQALKFSAAGEVIDCYPILSGTSRNCAGGTTPWGTWLSGEETPSTGKVWECDPEGKQQAVAHRAMGVFCHEAIVVHEPTETLYLTEDRPDGGFYRYTPRQYPSLRSGQLDIAELTETANREWHVRWHPVPNPAPFFPESNGIGDTATRYQVAPSFGFNGGEGLCMHNDLAYFSTKGDNRIWEYNIHADTMRLLYDVEDHAPNPILVGVDNILACHAGDILVAEDGGDMQLVLLRQSGDVEPILQVVGHDRSELTGPAFSPDYTRLYVSSQRGAGSHGKLGITFEITGPWT